jgi:sporulation protein YlmC with PRC-barrel domain
MEFSMKMTLTAVTALMIAVSPLAAQTNTPAPSATSFVDQQNQSEVLGTDFVGTAVTTKDGQQVGKISNLVFDENGRIELAVIGVGGFLGIGEKEVAVPFDSVKSEVVNNKHVFTVDATKEQLQAAPAFKTLNDQAFKERLAGWRTKASQSWAEVKARASKAYDDAKTRVNEARQPAEPPKPTPQ